LIYRSIDSAALKAQQASTRSPAGKDGMVAQSIWLQMICADFLLLCESESRDQRELPRDLRAVLR
jgi:hypothetical protein